MKGSTTSRSARGASDFPDDLDQAGVSCIKIDKGEDSGED
jgi:hypothetical protein